MSDNVFEGKTVEAAVESAANALGVTAAEVRYEVVEDGGADFWGLDDPSVKVKAWVAEAPAEPEPGSEEAAAEDPHEAAEASPLTEETAEQEAAPVSEEPSHEEAAPPAAFEESPREEAAMPADAEPAAVEAEESAPEPADAGFFGVPEGDAPAGSAVQESAEPTEPTAEIETQETGAAPDAEASEGAEPTGPAEPEPVAELEADAADTGDRAAAPPTGGSADSSADLSAEDLGAEVKELLERVFQCMDFDCVAEVEDQGDALQVAITGEDNEYLLDGRGRGLAALELILNHAFRHRADRPGRKIRVDAGDFRSQREDEIRDLAYQVAHQAKETDSPQQTRPLNPYERRIVHLTLADDSGVTTRSQGNGFLKAVNVIPQSGRR